MQNVNVSERNIQERLQVLNDYIQRSIDVLNEVRATALGIARPELFGGAIGLSHTGIMNPMVGAMAGQYLHQHPLLSHLLAQSAYGQQATPFAGVGGLSHTPWAQQGFGYGQVGLGALGALGQIPTWQTQFGMPHIGGLSHTGAFGYSPFAGLSPVAAALGQVPGLGFSQVPGYGFGQGRLF